jgi:23S rRNA (cytosine1962-C5)-methyltransferase
VDLFASVNRRRLVLKSGKERVVANRHPWIFAGAIARESGNAEAALADLVDGEGKLLASGFYSSKSQIRLRVLTFGDEELSAASLSGRLEAAFARRTFDHGNAARLVNSEGDDLSGLVIDQYDDLAVIEIANAGLDALKDIVVDALAARGLRRLYFKNDLPARKLEGLPPEDVMQGGGEPVAEIVENGLRFTIEPALGQKTGFFLDQRENRLLTRSLARGKRVLNLFSYTGAFGVYAAAGGAAHVDNVDISAKAIDVAKRNYELNGLAASFTVADAFSFVRQTRERWDLIVCDPPAFAKSHADVDRAARGYKDVNLYALRLLNPGGMLMTFSCSGHMSGDLFQKVIFSAALDAGKRASFVRRLTAAPDHPVSLYAPEGEYLKGMVVATLA